jgi:hypothetical protein
LLVARTVRGQTVTLEDFKLVGNLANPARATFTFTANARVKDNTVDCWTCCPVRSR